MKNQRKLAAIMFSDITGYSALMSKDEKVAMRVLEKNRSIHKSAISRFKGEYIKEVGDGTLAIFQSSIDAIYCAIAIQKACYKEKWPSLRIGIHTGDIIIREGDVFGDSVNVASRIEAAGEPGGIYLSEKVYDDIKNKAGIRVEFFGEKVLKNIPEPVKIYSIISLHGKTENLKTDLSVTDRTLEKSIIVLPFENLSADPEQEYFSDGLTEEIITDLSQVGGLLVISRSSAMTFKSCRATVKEIAEKVKVNYVLEGSVRRAGNNLRITAQLIDAANDSHLWAEKYTGTVEDVFNIQENVSRAIVSALMLKLSSEEELKIARRPIDNFRAYECYHKAMAEIFKLTGDSINHAIEYLKDALNIIGNNALLLSGIAYAYFQLVNLGAGQEEAVRKAEEYANKALNLDPDSSKAYSVLGWISLLTNLRKTYDFFKKARLINPDDTLMLQGLAIFYVQCVGKIEAAKPLYERLIRIDPLDYIPRWLKGGIPFYNGDYHLALQPFKALYLSSPEISPYLYNYAITLASLGQFEEAIKIIDQSIDSTDADSFTRLSRILKYAIRRDRDRAFGEMTPDFRDTCKRDCTFSHHLAGMFALLDEKTEALYWLQNAYERGFINYTLLSEKDPLLTGIRGEEQFKKIIELVKFEWENLKV